MSRSPKIGLLPLYLKLYDDTFPDLRNEFEPFIKMVIDGFAGRGVQTERAEICRLQPEFEQAMQFFAERDVDLIVTLHLAYSLSLESIAALKKANRPILLLDATMDFAFDQNVDPARIMFNHGIHGVQDLACMLRREKVPYDVVAGHLRESKILQRAAGYAKAACAARCFKNSRLLRIGGAFAGMGDFSVPVSLLQNRFGMTVNEITPVALGDSIRSLEPREIEEEIQLDRERFQAEAPEDVHRRSVRVGLGLRKYLEAENYSGFSQNFLAFDSAEPPVETVPFLEASKAMARGVGYAGEGDVLTAALVGALAKGFGKTTFTEAFCPDWKNGSLFLSHMGEINPDVSSQKPLLCEKDFPWAGALNPAIAACAPAEGPATLVNLAPGPDDSFRLIVAPVNVLPDTTNPALRTAVRGWIQPRFELGRFLERYSQSGGTHHSALLVGEWTEAVSAFAFYLGVERIVLHE